MTHTTAPADTVAEVLDAALASYRGRTAENYGYALRAWRRWCTDVDVDPVAPARRDIEAWIGHMSEDGLSDVTIRSYLNGLTALTRWLVAEDLLDRDPMTGVRRPRTTRHTGRPWLSRPEVAALVAATAQLDYPAARAVLLIHALCGTRPAEPLALNISDVGTRLLDVDGELVEYTTLTLRDRKPGVTDTITVPEVVGEAVGDAIDGRTSGPLIVSRHTGYRMSQHTVRTLTRRTLDLAGIARPVTPYGLRHSFITLALEARESERAVAAAVGQVTTAQIPVYDRLRRVAGGDVARRVYAHLATE